eukprot:TRINITY_DN9912_c0_g1_i2.p1 TRINITY_DN9912_c0_g1~~TRINITY_DN9912_c0_g1_i2.p1  ORF type:complete len:320 (+),score=83.35 TRINITY_DN9912_c0_g1_i2:118-1077(+)
MVLVKEFRIPMPFTLEEYQIGQRYSVAKMSNENTTGSEGIEVLENKPYEYVDPNDPDKKVQHGTHTKKIYHLKSLIPSWLTPFIPASALKLEEEAWDVFPYCKTVLTFPFLGERFVFTIESRYAPGEKGQIENIHNLDKEILKKRDVELLDITTCKEYIDKKYYKKEEDPMIFSSEKHGKGPLNASWLKDQPTSNVMCAYKLVTLRCKITGLQGKIEKYMMNLERSIFSRFHMQQFCWIDEWYGKSMDEIAVLEAKMFDDMNSKLGIAKSSSATGETKGEDKETVLVNLPPENGTPDEEVVETEEESETETKDVGSSLH